MAFFTMIRVVVLLVTSNRAYNNVGYRGEQREQANVTDRPYPAGRPICLSRSRIPLT